jgi:hypothetical protein
LEGKINQRKEDNVDHSCSEEKEHEESICVRPSEPDHGWEDPYNVEKVRYLFIIAVLEWQFHKRRQEKVVDLSVHYQK